MRYQRLAIIGAVSIFASCGGDGKVEESPQVRALQAEVKRSVFPYVFVASEEDVEFFVGCYEVELRRGFRRPCELA